MELLFIGLAAGAIVAYFIYSFFNKSKRKENEEHQSIVLMEKIRAVCKFITVEGDFSEIYHYHNMKDKWLNLFLGSKKALILIEAKAHVGFDLTKLKLNSDVEKKTIFLSNFPQPELLTIETDFKYYDKREGWANPFTSSDLTDINREAKQHIVDKIPNSGLLKEASSQALETIHLIEKLVETINWKLDYSALEINSNPQQLSSAKFKKEIEK
ncbi:DUF4230 domain-containing protein [Mesonia aestuariivivens]|uniref:DUF4230 domain-containing protein n=1 Tax=Mesonia aestuariivivens TaxID=2796128 RepID=A0ABS6W5Z3_9FLAO|nr:DUF4230 domain-containing protein [Mesonia aestuariivivens]MBW2962564.1 DUF4230 domain-containing protein [Mesonia aestuariivivens]